MKKRIIIVFLIIISLTLILFFAFNDFKIVNFKNIFRTQNTVKDITFEPYSNDNTLKILVTVEDSENYITDLTYKNKDDTNTTITVNKNKFAIDYEILEDGEYDFIAHNSIGETIQKTLNIDSDFRNLIDIQIIPESSSELVTKANITIDYKDNSLSTTDKYKIGKSNKWENYNGSFSVDSYQILDNSYQEDDGKTLIIYAQKSDNAKNIVTISKKTAIFDLDMPQLPKITVMEVLDNYATITQSGILVKSKIKIEYEDRADTKKLYSIDNGNTWNEYTGEFLSDTVHIIAKNEKIISGLNNQKDIYISPKSKDAIGVLAYDLKKDTYITTDTEKYILVNKEMNNKTINVKISAIDRWWGTGFTSYIFFYDEDNNLLHTETIKAKEGTFKYTIPDNCVKISYKGHTAYGSSGGYPWYARLYEISVNT